MFRSTLTGTAPPPPDVDTSEPLIPVSQLTLDLPEPPAGWTAYLNAKSVEVVTDDIGRLSIARGDARQLFDERREAEAGRPRNALRRNGRQSSVTGSGGPSWTPV